MIVHMMKLIPVLILAVFPVITWAHTAEQANGETLYPSVFVGEPFTTDTVTPEGSTKEELLLNNADPLAAEKTRSVWIIGLVGAVCVATAVMSTGRSKPV